jgi:hypothetical protein
MEAKHYTMCKVCLLPKFIAGSKKAHRVRKRLLRAWAASMEQRT